MTVLVSGSIAFDSIMVFQDQFKNHILPDKVHMLNVSFLAPDLRREYGGCAGNICYNLNLLGVASAPLSTVGDDFEPYAKWMQTCGVDTRFVARIADSYTAQAYIITDKDDNQITAFHPGAMSFAHTVSVPANQGITMGMVSPNGRDGMLQHARQFSEAGIPFMFDPGQGLPMFSGEELLQMAEMASWVALNSYEGQLFQEKTGKSFDEIANLVDALIVTQGSEGSVIYVDGAVLNVPVVPSAQVVDPTGCGDAYRAGLIFGIQRNLPWEVTGRIASMMGSLKVAQPGTQNHDITLEELAAGYETLFNEALPIEL